MLPSLLLLFLLSHICFGNLNQQCEGDSLTVNCRSHHEMHYMINTLKEEMKMLQQNQDPNCTVCWSGPCLNNGQCTPLNVTTYRCDCPKDYAGPICETHVECKPHSCGPNAKCHVANHQINCVCDFGLSGDPFVGCYAKTVRACMSGDPHYTTFDKQYYEYMGTCPYVFVKPCNESSILPYEYFEVKAKNELSYPGAHVSHVEEIEVLMSGHIIHVTKNYVLSFDGIRKSTPFYYPNKDNASIAITTKNSFVTIDNLQLVVVQFSYGWLCVQIPDNDEFQGKEKLCGLGGNRDGDCRDDFVFQGGDTHLVSGCHTNYQKISEEFGDTWITDDFHTVNPGACLRGVDVTNTNITCDLEAAKIKCKDIYNANLGKGPFAACKGLGETRIDTVYRQCTYDVCNDDSLLCGAYSSFAKMCQSELPNTPLIWRKQEGCSELHCPLHSTYKPCATGCPRTCSKPDYISTCPENCMEGCECDPGYFLDESNPKEIQCVPLDDCGCKDDDNNYHKSGDRWLTDNCTRVNFCMNGTYNWEIQNCSRNGFCDVNNDNEYQCSCNKGYHGDGYECIDTNECSNLATCNAGTGHGTCINEPGSYHCECHPYYDDHDNCDTYLPLRHCADLRFYHQKTVDGVYDIRPQYSFLGKPSYTPVSVYCDMTTMDGGWTVMSASKSNIFANKTFNQYYEGFGYPAKQEVWLGLELIHYMTNEMETSLRIDLHRCAGKRKPEKSTYCIYPEFKLLDYQSRYAVVIPYGCDGTEVTYEEGWARWDEDVGPKFVAFDTDKSNCSKYYQSTGWWFDTKRLCGAANLNGIRYSCDKIPSSGDLTHYLKWNENTVNFAQLYLRPEDYPDYEPLPTEETTTLDPFFTESTLVETPTSTTTEEATTSTTSAEATTLTTAEEATTSTTTEEATTSTTSAEATTLTTAEEETTLTTAEEATTSTTTEEATTSTTSAEATTLTTAEEATTSTTTEEATTSTTSAEATTLTTAEEETTSTTTEEATTSTIEEVSYAETSTVSVEDVPSSTIDSFPLYKSRIIRKAKNITKTKHFKNHHPRKLHKQISDDFKQRKL